MSREIVINAENVKKIQNAVTSDIQKRYGNKPDRLAVAEQAKYYADEFLFNLPIGMTPNFRVSDLQVKMSDYIHKRFQDESSK